MANWQLFALVAESVCSLPRGANPRTAVDGEREGRVHFEGGLGLCRAGAGCAAEVSATRRADDLFCAVPELIGSAIGIAKPQAVG